MNSININLLLPIIHIATGVSVYMNRWMDKGRSKYQPFRVGT